MVLLGICVSPGLAQQHAKDQTSAKQPSAASPLPAPQTETIPPPKPVETAPPAKAPGFMEPADVKALAHKVWIVEYHTRDLLAEVHPENWKISNITRNSFNQTLENLRKSLDGLEEWRAQFDNRPDGIYFGFQTYAAINAALPRLDGVAHAVSQFQNPSFGAQFSQVGDRLFDLQQELQPYIAYLLRSPDQTLYVAQANLAGCQSRLSDALRGQTGPAKPMKNTFVEFYPRHRKKEQAESNDKRTSPQSGEKKTASKSEKKPGP